MRAEPRSARTALAPHRLRSTSFVRSAEIRPDVDALLAHRSFTASTCAAQQDTQRSGESLGGRRAPPSAVEGRRSAGGGSGAPTRAVAPSHEIGGGVAQGPPLFGLRCSFGIWPGPCLAGRGPAPNHPVTRCNRGETLRIKGSSLGAIFLFQSTYHQFYKILVEHMQQRYIKLRFGDRNYFLDSVLPRRYDGRGADIYDTIRSFPELERHIPHTGIRIGDLVRN